MSAYDAAVRRAADDDGLSRREVDMSKSNIHFVFVCECGGAIQTEGNLTGVHCIVCAGCHSTYVLYAEVSPILLLPKEVRKVRCEMATSIVAIEPK